MTFLSFILFTHIAATLGLFAGLGVEWLILPALRGTASLAEARTWIEYGPRLSRLILASLVLVVISGVYLTSRFSAWGRGWIEVSLASLLFLAPLSAVAALKMRTVRKHIFAGRSGHVIGGTVLALSQSCKSSRARNRHANDHQS